MYLYNYGLDVFHRSLQRHFCIFRGGLDSEIIHFDLCIGILVVRKVQKVVLFLSHPEIQSLSVLSGLMSSIKVPIESSYVVQE